jgi:Fe2+ or Zn2+ uptake regulation protein
VSRELRVTPAISAVMRVILDAHDRGSPAWGLSICEATGYGISTVYPALNRLRKAGWIEDWWEDQPGDRPKRRFYKPAYIPQWYSERM